MAAEELVNSSHWGAFTASLDEQGLSVKPDPADPDPSELLRNIPASFDKGVRVLHPSVRRGWLDDGPGPSTRRGSDDYVEVSWDRALDLLAAELERVRSTYGNPAIFGGSYGWASAGRFHHAQSQIHRFLNTIGGYTRSVHSYSHGASSVLLPHIVGDEAPLYRPTTWNVLSEHTDLFVCFGGVPAKNFQINAGGISRHTVRESLEDARARGAEFVTISPLADDLATVIDAQWISINPATDTALILALCWVLLSEGLCDLEFVDKYTVGFEEFARYLRGQSDGIAKTPGWAATICGVDASTIADLARRMAGCRTMVTTSWSLQRARFGEQPVWASIALAAFLGQIGLPGGGFGHGYGSTGGMGAGRLPYPLPTFHQGVNPVNDFIPVARISDMLLHPGSTYDFNGQSRVYPDTKLIYWAGGNPFHHHQDLVRLRAGFQQPDTVVVHEPFWTATARHADIVLPATTTLERNDIGCGRYDDIMTAMQQVASPVGESLSDYAILTKLSKRLAVEEQFTEGRDEWGWLEHIYERWRESIPDQFTPNENFAQFWAARHLDLPGADSKHVLYEDFRSDPEKFRLATPSGRIEISSPTIARFGYDDCPPHPTWLAPAETVAVGTGPYPLCLVANNPASRLHSQLDNGAVSVESKVLGREPIRLNPADATAREIKAGDLVLVRSDTGRMLAGAILDDRVRANVVQISTGAWFDHSSPEVAACIHGNPNVLTRDAGSSKLTQGSTGQLVRVEVEVYRGEAPDVVVHDQRLWMHPA
ncbi:biotin/methionine sulfoxide reductase [Williamsia limnetica]|uniref:Biotin/methionine sulfoxide reductase n=1 Tax=Williamsia limnetica TaxID=882452 RepID=A0A318RL03_WILLI|nr:molybdopterin-dependent oxidoreductase [Williamsia limnetica]PYE16009.1 biotin/methionine sulfoxide reductase [Williamsia limnetica]